MKNGTGWFFDAKHDCWCLTDVVYTEKAVLPEYQQLNIFVPRPYMKDGGVIDAAGVHSGYTAQSAPVVFENNSAGYMQMKQKTPEDKRCRAKQYLERGFVYVSCGNRGKESADENGTLCGKSPANLVDLKTAVRFLRHYRELLPGDFERIISVGCSAGGAMSALLAVTANHRDFEPYLRENGAYMDERDDVFAAQIYCPIIDLEHADMAYEWTFGADCENEASHAGPAGRMTLFQEALSRELGKRYITYFNSLRLKHPQTGEALSIGEDGRSGSGYAYLMSCLERSAADYLSRLENGTLEQASIEVRRPEDGMIEAGHAEDTVSGAGVMCKTDENAGKNGAAEAYAASRSGWLSWNGTAHIRDLDAYILQYRRRMKPCTSFDTLTMHCNENEVFGSEEQPFVHFGEGIAESIRALREQFPQEYEQYYGAFVKSASDEALERRVALYNPMNYIGAGKEGDAPQFFRIRVGAFDADTSWMVSMALALRLAERGKDVDYALVWDQPHGQADYRGEVCDWIERICPAR